MAAVESIIVGEDEAGMRLDRWFKAHYPGLAFVQLQKLVRTGQVRVDAKRVETSTRILPGQTVRVPPLATDLKEVRPKEENRPLEGDAAFLTSLILWEDADVMVLNKPAGLSVQGGSGVTRHVDAMLESLADKKGQVPRLVHRLDKDTAGCLVIARRRLIAATLAATFRSRSAHKTYWALVAGVPHPKQGKISTWLARDEEGDGDKMRIARHGEQGAAHALTHYSVVDTAGQTLAWLSLKPTTGRTHQLRAHTAHIGHPIIGDPKYFDKRDWALPGGMQNRLHLLARRIVLPHPSGRGIIDVTAPLPPHMRQSWNLLGFDASAYDPDVDEAFGD
jgi:23S rRNA pseudouridine955/2504/2580 synthase